MLRVCGVWGAAPQRKLLLSHPAPRSEVFAVVGVIGCLRDQSRKIKTCTRTSIDTLPSVNDIRRGQRAERAPCRGKTVTPTSRRWKQAGRGVQTGSKFRLHVSDGNFFSCRRRCFLPREHSGRRTRITRHHSVSVLLSWSKSA